MKEETRIPKIEERLGRDKLHVDNMPQLMAGFNDRSISSGKKAPLAGKGEELSSHLKTSERRPVYLTGVCIGYRLQDHKSVLASH